MVSIVDMRGVLLPNSTDPIYDSQFPLGNRSAGGVGGVQLAAGHFVAQKFSMVSIQPRPDSETGNFSGTVNSRYRWAYYDGVNPIQYEFPIKIFGGSAPHRYSIISAPAGAAVGNLWNPASHGVVTWTPQAAFPTNAPASFTIRVTGQDGQTLDLTWTVATTSSTSKFLFLSNSGNDTTGNGSISNPYATIAKVIGTTKASSTFAGAHVYLRAGTYATSAHSDAFTYDASGNIRCELSPSLKPCSFMCYPNENVTISFAAAEVVLNDADHFWAGTGSGKLTLAGSCNAALETHNFWLRASRTCWSKVDFDGFIPRVNGGFTNSAPIFSDGSTPTPTRLYNCAHNVREINRTVESANDAMLWVFFGISYWADEYCSASRTGDTGRGCGFKDTCYNTSSRYMNISTGDSAGAYNIMSQNGGGNNEICYSTIRGTGWFNLQAYTGALGAMHEYRNTVYSTDTNNAGAWRAWGTAGGHAAWTSTNSILICITAPFVSSDITATGTECHTLVASTNKPINPTTLLLVDNAGGTAYRTLYLGTRGAEIQ